MCDEKKGRELHLNAAIECWSSMFVKVLCSSLYNLASDPCYIVNQLSNTLRIGLDSSLPGPLSKLDDMEVMAI